MGAVSVADALGELEALGRSEDFEQMPSVWRRFQSEMATTADQLMLVTDQAKLIRIGLDSLRVIGVARFSEPGVKAMLERQGIETIECDLLDRAALQRLPKVPNVVFMAGRKFGSSGNEPLTWAMNVMVPAVVAESFAASRIVAFSTGCVYPFVPVDSGGASVNGYSLSLGLRF